MFKYHQLFLFLFCLNEAGSLLTSYTDFYLESMKITHTKSSFLHGNVSLKRRGHDYPKLFLEIDLNDAISNYEVDGKFYYSPLGNSRFVLLPFKVTRRSVCSVMQLESIQRAFHSLQNFSTGVPPLPDDENVQYCELFTKKHYSVHDFMIDRSYFRKFVPTGRFRLVLFAYQRTKNEVVQSVEFLATFT